MPSYMAGKGISKGKNEAPARTASICQEPEKCVQMMGFPLHPTLLFLPTGAKSSLVVRGQTAWNSGQEITPKQRSEE